MTRTRRLGSVALTGTALALLAACAAPGSARSTAVAPAHPRVASAVPVVAMPTPIASPVVTSSAVVATEPTPTAVPTPVATTTALPPVPTFDPSSAAAVGAVNAGATRSPHFDTPDAAMEYLAAAYNAHDIAAEMHVTTPDSRSALEDERQWVQTFSFHSCTPNAGAGDYSCRFDMASMVPGLAIPSASATTDTAGDILGTTPAAMNEITELVAPAARPGWYMYFNMGCGEA